MDLTSLEIGYQDCQGLAQRFCASLQTEIAQLLSTRNITLGVPMEARVKSWKSITEKLERRAIILSSIKELNDLIGLRLILLFRRDLNTACQLIENTFQVISKEDTGERLSETQFGYQSLHYVVEVPKEWLAVPSMKDVSSLKAEIQVRTLAQHIWAAASHKLQYKMEQSVPVPVRRSIHRVSALLETIDLEFERVLQEREQYVQEDSAKNSTEELNVDLLAKTLGECLPAENKSGFENYSELLGDLSHYEIKTASDLRRIIDKHRETALKVDAEHVRSRKERESYVGTSKERIDRGVFYSHVGLTRQILEEEHPGKPWPWRPRNPRAGRGQKKRRPAKKAE